jgi:soluble lytic murein transglycosylase-like protein
MAIITVLVLVTLAMSWAVSTGSVGAGSSFGSRVGKLDPATIPNGWAPLLQQAAEEAGVPAPVLAAQIETESNWRADARSSAGAQGLAQFMPGTWATFGQGGDPHNPEHAIAAQGRYMGYLLDLAESSDIAGDPLELALAGYNAGFGAVQRYGGIPPYPETENYVRLIRERTATYERS